MSEPTDPIDQAAQRVAEHAAKVLTEAIVQELRELKSTQRRVRELLARSRRAQTRVQAMYDAIRSPDLMAVSPDPALAPSSSSSATSRAGTCSCPHPQGRPAARASDRSCAPGTGPSAAGLQNSETGPAA